jgi:hypothetical protein
MESHLQDRKQISAAEPRPSPENSQSQIQEPSISPGRRIPPRNVPPIVTKDAKTPQNAQSYSSASRCFENQEDNKDMGIEDDIFSNEDGQEEALQALASYAAFQLTLLRHIAEDPRYIEFAYQTRVSATFGQTEFHSGQFPEDFVPDFALGTDTRPEIDSDIKE